MSTEFEKPRWPPKPYFYNEKGQMTVMLGFGQVSLCILDVAEVDKVLVFVSTDGDETQIGKPDTKNDDKTLAELDPFLSLYFDRADSVDVLIGQLERIKQSILAAEGVLNAI